MCLRCSTKPSLTHGMKTSRKEMNTFRSILTFHYEHCEEYYSESELLPAILWVHSAAALQPSYQSKLKLYDLVYITREKKQTKGRWNPNLRFVEIRK